VALEDRQILDAFRRLPAAEGVFCEPASAASFAGLVQARADGTIPEGARVVCILTGHGLKDPDTAIGEAERPRRCGATLSEIEQAVLAD
jgi:threonine synthase